jgi:hypothetical protein
MDNLKEYLLHHKADLDVDSPASDGWEKIETKMSERSGYLSWVKYAVAACVIVLAGAGLWMVTKNNKKEPVVVNRGALSGKEKGGDSLPKEEKTAEAGRPEKKEGAGQSEETAAAGGQVKRAGEERKRHKARAPKPGEVSDAVADVDRSYSKLIDFELRKLRTTPLYAENGSYFSFYTEQLKQMDLDERAVRNDIKTYGLTGVFLEQLINVYQQKLTLLKNLQTEINKMNNKVRGKQGPSGKPEVYYLNI